MTVLVTGGAGYVGSETVRALRAAGRGVVVLDNLDTGHPAAVPGVPLVVGDIADDGLVARTVADHGVDAVIHFAGRKAAGESMTDPGGYFRVNVAGAIALLDTVARAGVRTVVFSSSCAVYGTPDALPVTEGAPLRPESPYGESKLAVERLLGWWDRAAGVRSVCLRYFNAVGADRSGAHGEDWDRTQCLLPSALRALAGRSAPLQIHGTDYPTPDGTAVRDYVHVHDLARAHIMALRYLDGGAGSASFNLGTGRGTSVLEVLDCVASVTGQRVPAHPAPRRPGDPAGLFADCSLAAATLGWVPELTLPDAVAAAWRWHTAHPDGYPGTRTGRLDTATATR